MFNPCPLYPQKRTSLGAIVMSTLCHKRTFQRGLNYLICHILPPIRA